MLKFAQDLHSFLRTCQNLYYPYPRDYTQCFPSGHSFFYEGPLDFSWWSTKKTVILRGEITLKVQGHVSLLKTHGLKAWTCANVKRQQ